MGRFFPTLSEGLSLPFRILVLDDEPVLRALIARILVEEGYEVTPLADAPRAIEVIGDGGYDLVITNSVMHGARGAQLVARLRQAHPRLPILHIDDGTNVAPPEFPPDVRTVVKPFGRDVLLEQVRLLLDRTAD